MRRIVFDRNTPHDVRSVTKSVVSALVGVAVGSGAIRGTDDLVLDYFPEYSRVAHPGWHQVTLRHALDMTAGVRWEEVSGGVDRARMNRSPDLLRFVFEQPIVHPPGTRWNYNGGLTQLLGEIVQRATGVPLDRYARERLFEPLGIKGVEWMPNAGRFSIDADSGLRLRGRDLLKVGLLYAQEGRWQGRQIVPREWVRTSLQRQVLLTGPIVEYREDASGELGYGHQWYHARFTMPYGTFTAHQALGNGGQTIFLSPELGVTAVVLAGAYDQGHDVRRLLLERVAPWAAGERSAFRFWSERVVQRVQAGEWSIAPLAPAQRTTYLGLYDHDGSTVRVWEEAGVLHITPLPGMEGAPVHLVPTGDHVFAFGHFERGRLTKIYWPENVLEFEIDGGRAVRYLDRTTSGTVLTRAARIR